MNEYQLTKIEHIQNVKKRTTSTLVYSSNSLTTLIDENSFILVNRKWSDSYFVGMANNIDYMDTCRIIIPN